ncbi:uroporphyrinogen-III C-methyltransferase [Metabacillus elymi]|uniref:uroporphyrinogen-III C-methyltransferase n=1 Tax=Metabacillus elymi TaxID=2745198 RepID=A0ABX6S2V1_9BACI|nr:uroporphyrinogen-III C-methyltransferase [Metabacillus sp. KUDC1714]QNF27563.1 uroporphyrinogen-III C-methyltransferase [Metabacillus sp. KUDC1714]
MQMGKVYLVGAGPGDSELITVKGMEAIKKAEVILYDRLVNPRLLDYAKADCELIYCGKLPNRHFMKQEEINRTLLEKALAGFTVVRLKGGDPSVFGRVGEEAEVLAEQNVAYEIVPGITSGIAAPLYAGIPVTHRDYAGSFAMVTAHDKSKNGKPDIDWEGLARGVQTIAFYMGVSNLEHICENLIFHGKAPDTPVIVIRWGTWSRQESVVGTLSSIVEKVREGNIENPAITLVGDIVATREKIKWFEKKPLFGQQLLYVRGCAEEESFAHEYLNQGADVIEFPKWEVNKGSLDVKVRKKLPAYKRMLFMSTEAATNFFKLLKSYKIDIRQLQARLFCKQSTTIKLLEDKGFLSGLADELDSEGSLLIIGSNDHSEKNWKLDYKYGEHDYAGVYQASIDKRYESIIRRSIEDASISAILFSTSDSVHTFMKQAAHYGVALQSFAQTTDIICLNKQAWLTATNYGLNPRMQDENNKLYVEDFSQNSKNLIVSSKTY